MKYFDSIRLDRPYQQAVIRVREVLAEQGFGVLTEIDVRATMKAKLGEDMEDYVILGACTPRWRTRRSKWNGRSGCCFRATSSCADPMALVSSRSWTPCHGCSTRA